MFRFFESFLAKMKAGFQRIARATKNEMTVGDLHNDAWVIALEIGDRRGKPIDFSDEADQELVMRAVNLQNVRRGDWNMRRSVRIDQGPDGEDEGRTWDLPAQAASDPLVSLLRLELDQQQGAILADSYSQAAAYVVTFDNFGNDRGKVCSHLNVSDGTLARRVSYAADTVKVQPSVFDRIERIPADFIPKRGKHLASKVEDTRETEQCAWDFEPA